MQHIAHLEACVHSKLAMSYDGDVSVYDQNGKMMQLQYACEAPRLGVPIVGIAGSKLAVLVSVRKNRSKLAAFQAKTYKVSNTIGCSASGIFADARKILNMLRAECQDYEYTCNTPISLKELVINLADEAQQRTQYSQFRPFGVSLLFIGNDEGKPALFCVEPNAEYYKFKAHCIGQNS